MEVEHIAAIQAAPSNRTRCGRESQRRVRHCAADRVLEIQLSLVCLFTSPRAVDRVLENSRAKPETSVAVERRAFCPITVQDLRVRIAAERAPWRPQECEEARRCNVVDHRGVIKGLKAAQRELNTVYADTIAWYLNLLTLWTRCVHTQTNVTSIYSPSDLKKMLGILGMCLEFELLGFLGSCLELRLLGILGICRK